MPRKTKLDSDGQDFFTEILDMLQSQGIIEQLRLECIADVKTKQTYCQLKERVKDYLSNRISKDWVSDNTFREQVVECGLLALTVERVVDVVVSKKLQEEIRPLLEELIETFGGNYAASIQGYHSVSNGNNTSLRKETINSVNKICNDTRRDYKKVREGGVVANSLASVSFSNVAESDDETASENNSDMSNNSSPHEEAEKMDVESSESLDESPEAPLSRSRRERKLNPKYSEYQTSFPANLQTVPAPKEHHSKSSMMNGSVATIAKKSVPEKEPPPKRKLVETPQDKEKSKKPPLQKEPVAKKTNLEQDMNTIDAEKTAAVTKATIAKKTHISPERGVNNVDTEKTTTLKILVSKKVESDVNAIDTEKAAAVSKAPIARKTRVSLDRDINTINTEKTTATSKIQIARKTHISPERDLDTIDTEQAAASSKTPVAKKTRVSFDKDVTTMDTGKAADSLKMSIARKTRVSPDRDVNTGDNVRKSGRQRKVNSIVFFDSLPPMTSSPSGHQEQEMKLPQENKTVPKVIVRPASFIVEDLETLKSGVQKRLAVPVEDPVAESEVGTVHSTKRYDSSDLYKPRMSSATRMKRMRAVP